MENGFFSRPYTSACRPASASLAFSAATISSTRPALLLVDVVQLVDHRLVGFGLPHLKASCLELLAQRLHAHAAGRAAHRSRASPRRRCGGSPASCARACACCAGGRASLISRTRMSLEMATRSLRKFSACSAFLVTRSRLLDLGEALDQRADLLAELLVDLGARDVGVLDRRAAARRRWWRRRA